MYQPRSQPELAVRFASGERHVRVLDPSTLRAIHDEMHERGGETASRRTVAVTHHGAAAGTGGTPLDPVLDSPAPRRPTPTRSPAVKKVRNSFFNEQEQEGEEGKGGGGGSGGGSGGDVRDDHGGSFFTDVYFKFMRESSLHGLKYLTERGRHPAEKVFWVAALVVSWIFCGYLIFKVMERWAQSPVLVAFDNMQTGIYEIPFPSLTICNMNKIKKSRVEHIDEELAKDPDNSFFYTEKRFVEEICAKHESLVLKGGGKDGGNKTHPDPGQHAQPVKDEEHGGGGPQADEGDLQLSGDDLHYYMSDLGYSCQEMLLRCHFQGRFFDCSDIFVPTITDEGQCCSFNTMPESIMFRNSVTEIDPEEEDRWAKWNMQTGYSTQPNKETLHDIRDMPLRALAPGLHMGLSIVVDVKEEEYYCTGHESHGFKMVEYGYALAPGTEAFYAVTPKIIHADEAIYTFPVEKRGCYLEGERELTFFREYTFLNCFMECASNFTFQHCGCVAYYMPRNPIRMPICAPEKVHCVDEAVTIVEESAYDTRHNSNTNCRCLSPCTDMEFPHETSFGNLRKADMISLPREIMDKHPEYLNDTYVKNNLAIMHVYFKHLHFMSNERGELYSIVDFFSNIGGLLGLCAGLSVLSVAELIYFFTLRLYHNVSTPRMESE